MLKIKFWRIENVVLMKVLEQGEEIKRGSGEFFHTNKLVLQSDNSPEINPENIFVRGLDKEKENTVSAFVFKNCIIAENYIEFATEAIHAYNQSLSKEPEQTDDIETVIAE